MQLQSIIQQYKPLFIEKYGSRLLPSQWRAIHAMQRCRTPDCGELYVQCTQCSARTMKSVNGWIDNKKSYCLLSILW